jgi:hypothetical protein
MQIICKIELEGVQVKVKATMGPLGSFQIGWTTMILMWFHNGVQIRELETKLDCFPVKV